MAVYISVIHATLVNILLILTLLRANGCHYNLYSIDLEALTG
jgi:hypothetical protein